jgi:hypothetical protein
MDFLEKQKLEQILKLNDHVMQLQNKEIERLSKLVDHLEDILKYKPILIDNKE